MYYCTVPGDQTDGGDVSVTLASDEQTTTSAALVEVEVVDERTGSSQVFQFRSIEEVVIPAEAISGVCDQGQQTRTISHRSNRMAALEV